MQTITLNVQGGARIRVPYALNQITPYVLLEQEDWFEDEIRFVRKYLQPGMNAIDIGANFGVYTLAMAAAVGAQGGVWAFEPTPDTAAMLRASVEENGAHQVRVHQTAVSDRAGTASFSLHAEPELNALAAAGSGGITVQTVTLDEMARQERWGDIHLVKIDAEGHESQVIAGGEQFFRSQSPLVLFEIRVGGRLDLSAAARFDAIGFQLYYLIPGPMLLVPFDPRQPMDPFVLNLFACKTSVAAALVERGMLAAGAAPCDVSARAAREAWIAYQRSTAYAPALSFAWPQRPGLFTSADSKTYLDALYLFAWSRSGAPDPSQRLGLLHSALARVKEARAKRDTLPRLVTFARLAWETGQRAEAVAALSAAGPRIEAEAETIRREPFLPPAPRYEQIRPGTSAKEWLLCAVAETYERLSAFSSLYAPESSLPMMEGISGSLLRSPETERRRQLARMLAGTQDRPEPHPLLSERTDENLNPQFWCGSAITA